jgi:5-deoxy-glucuronate isomerase
VLAADALIACEVLTAAGNWSSWPPHKHDTERPGEETALEEVYYFETRAAGGGTGGTDPVGYQRVYASERGRPIDVLAEVRTGDVVLVPYGWHGPSIAAPDADLYYLNVMAGPGPERAWLIRDDPAHATTRTTWPTQPFDPRLGPSTRSAPGDPAAPDPTDHADGPRTADPSDRTHAADPADPAAPGDGSAGTAGTTPPNDDPAPGGAV